MRTLRSAALATSALLFSSACSESGTGVANPIGGAGFAALGGGSGAGASGIAGAAGGATGSGGMAASGGAVGVSGGSSSGAGIGGTGGAGGSAGAMGTGGAGTGGAGTGGLWGEPNAFPELKLPISLPQSEPPKPCPAGSVIEKTSNEALYSWPGSVFSTVAISGQGQNHAPGKLKVRVTKGGQPVSGCEVRFRAAPGNGWGFGATKATDAQGNLYGYWTAGDVGTNTISAAIALDSGETSKVDFTGVVSDHTSRTQSIHFYYDVDAGYTELKIRVTALTAPPATYYSALNWPNAYMGIQFDGGTSVVIFSVWDANGEKAQITDKGACNEVVGFGGEGTGTSCRLKFPPSDQGTVAGLPDDYRLKVGDTYELHLSLKASSTGGTAQSLTFTDLTRNIGPISLGTQTTGGAFHGGQYGEGFVEEWAPHGSCLSNTRAVLYHGLEQKVGGSWQPVKSGSLRPLYKNDNNEICGNYFSTRVDNTFMLSSGGVEYVGRPYVPGDGAFGLPVSQVQLP